VFRFEAYTKGVGNEYDVGGIRISPAANKAPEGGPEGIMDTFEINGDDFAGRMGIFWEVRVLESSCNVNRMSL